SRNSSDTNTESSATQKILFTKRESGYKWSGPLFNNLPGTLVDIRYPVGEDDLAGKLLSNAEIIYPQLAASLNIEKPNKVTITLYKIDDNFNTSISLSFPKSDSAAAWTNQGSNIKIKLIPNTSVKDYIPALATQLSRNLLRQIGVTSEWLISGVSSHLSKPYDQGRPHDFVGTNLVKLAESAKAGRLTPLNIIQPIYLIPESQQNLINAQTWDAVNYLITSYGWPALLDILHSQHQGINFNESFRNSTGLTLDDFEDGWRDSLSNDHILDNHIDTALEFNQDIAMQHVDYLSSSELAGRQAGSQGDTTAAAYIADKFETYGLIPVGDQTSITIKSNQDSSNRSDSIQLNSIITETISSYYQTFPISYTLQIADPQLELINNESNSVIELKYRQDYLIIQPLSNNNRSSVSDLVWVGEEGYQGINLNGRIALRNPVGELSEEIAKAVKHGAGGLLIAGTKQDDDEIFRKSPLTNVQTSTNMIPVYELTLDGYNRILDTIGHTHKSLKEITGIYPLELRLRNKTHLSSPKTVDTKNILGLLPGSDPFLSRETIIIGAHYDHVGDDPDGTRYSGGNDDASGIGVLLEIVRLWQETGFQPKHSILFAAWGAQEMGNLGSEFYVNHPALPLELTNAMIQLDGVGGGDGFNLGAQALWESDGILLFYLEAAGNALGENVVVTQPIGNSDHLPFQSEGLPTVLLSWRLASEDNLPDSMANTVHPERLEVSGRVTTLLLMNLSQ
ncbi:MAG: M28 family peptidase, partial [Anaerolineales bacterium]|nr:M28 family peptidase [Anaerolineales bacterium]